MGSPVVGCVGFETSNAHTLIAMERKSVQSASAMPGICAAQSQDKVAGVALNACRVIAGGEEAFRLESGRIVVVERIAGELPMSLFSTKILSQTLD